MGTYVQIAIAAEAEQIFYLFDFILMQIEPFEFVESVKALDFNDFVVAEVDNF